MKFLAAIGRVFLGFLASTGRLGMFAAISVSHCVRPPFYTRLIWPRLIWRQVAGDNLHPSGKVYAPWADTIVPLAELALLKEETP